MFPTKFISTPRFHNMTKLNKEVYCPHCSMPLWNYIVETFWMIESFCWFCTRTVRIGKVNPQTMLARKVEQAWTEGIDAS